MAQRRIVFSSVQIKIMKRLQQYNIRNMPLNFPKDSLVCILVENPDLSFATVNESFDDFSKLPSDVSSSEITFHDKHNYVTNRRRIIFSVG